MMRACYGRCESLTTFQCQVVENEAWPQQTDGSLGLPPVFELRGAERIPKGSQAHGGLQKAGRSVGKMEIADWFNR